MLAHRDTGDLVKLAGLLAIFAVMLIVIAAHFIAQPSERSVMMDSSERRLASQTVALAKCSARRSQVPPPSAKWACITKC